MNANRRNVIAGIGSIGLVGLAGCSDDDEENEEPVPEDDGEQDTDNGSEGSGEVPESYPDGFNETGVVDPDVAFGPESVLYEQDYITVEQTGQINDQSIELFHQGDVPNETVYQSRILAGQIQEYYLSEGVAYVASGPEGEREYNVQDEEWQDQIAYVLLIVGGAIGKEFEEVELAENGNILYSSTDPENTNVIRQQVEEVDNFYLELEISPEGLVKRAEYSVEGVGSETQTGEDSDTQEISESGTAVYSYEEISIPEPDWTAQAQEQQDQQEEDEE